MGSICANGAPQSDAERYWFDKYMNAEKSRYGLIQSNQSLTMTIHRLQDQLQDYAQQLDRPAIKTPIQMYQSDAVRTMPDGWPYEKTLTMLCFGLAGETGELIDALKKTHIPRARTGQGESQGRGRRRSLVLC